MEKLSDQLNELSTRTKQLEDSAVASQAASREMIETKVEEAKASIAKARDNVQSRIDEASGDASAYRKKAQESVSDWADKLKQRRAERKTERNLDHAVHDAAQADEDAAAAVDFAIYAVAVAEYAMADAVDTKQTADALLARV
jgi:hypothetical protein